jgi:hypothetical protein
MPDLPETCPRASDGPPRIAVTAAAGPQAHGEPQALAEEP